MRQMSATCMPSAEDAQSHLFKASSLFHHGRDTQRQALTSSSLMHGSLHRVRQQLQVLPVAAALDLQWHGWSQVGRQNQMAVQEQIKPVGLLQLAQTGKACSSVGGLVCTPLSLQQHIHIDPH